jgi:hypothetical protein
VRGRREWSVLSLGMHPGASARRERVKRVRVGDESEVRTRMGRGATLRRGLIGGFSSFFADSPARRSAPTVSPASSYSHPNSRLSPGNTPFSMSSSAYPASYPVSRPLTEDDSLTRHVAGLEAQVRQLSDSLHHHQVETQAARVMTHSVMRLLLNIVDGLGAKGEQKDESTSLTPFSHLIFPFSSSVSLTLFLRRLPPVEKCRAALVKLNPDVSPAASQNSTFAYTPFSASASWQGLPHPFTSVACSPHPGTSSSAEFFYQRPPPAESFARGGAGARRDSRDASGSPFLACPSFHTHHLFGTSSNGNYARGDSTSLQRGGGGGGGGYGLALPRPTSSGGYQGYPSPRPSWQGPGEGGGGRPPDTLPPLSAVFGHAVRRPIEEDGKDEARKKARK